MSFERLTSRQQQLYPIVSALVFSADQPLSNERLVALLKSKDGFNKTTTKDLMAVVDVLKSRLEDSGIQLVATSEGYRVEVLKDYLDWVYLLFEQNPPKLSRALLETLAIMAHKQPITRAEVESIRGVAVSTQIMNQLKHHGWVKSAGTKQVPGHPTLWVTTDKLVQDLGLTSKDALIEKLDRLVNDFLSDKQTQHVSQPIH
ncbi:SMC-Scp complex subunit ScpB [Thiomicrospira sp. R3]|uniref:SMC-Scp complex subunit ScpB n=1 Tax=Thiomicrospira sp. R3 TaxID=3035472 RepID=UPI00259B973C|nr:SMC-Scp complex subunit ScpB [Thiomicrospira sp. R3]WFE68455.1 SMC-Scp complex subunit ScpB [Thiomicrospira sp. R3]